jgi:hypothetical protein
MVAAFLAALAVRYWRAASLRSALALVLLALSAARIGYDLVVPAFRRQRSVDRFYEEVASVLTREYRDQPVLLAGRTAQHQRTIPIAGRTFTFSEPEWFSTSLSYYFTEGRNELLRYADALEPGKLYLVHTTFPVAPRHEVVRFFDSPRGDADDLKLIRLRE